MTNYRVKEALYSHFTKEIYLHTQYYFKNEGQCVLILYDKDRLLYPHYLEYGYTCIACMDKDNYVDLN